MEKDTSGDHRSSSPDVASDDEMEEEDEPRKPKPRKRRTGAASKRLTKHNKDADPSKAAILDRKQAVPHVQRWLSKTLEEKEGGSLLKRELFERYLRFCVRNGIEATNDATFGRIVNRVFPRVQQRRLRREPHVKKWHYCGIAYRTTLEPIPTTNRFSPPQVSVPPDHSFQQAPLINTDARAAYPTPARHQYNYVIDHERHHSTIPSAQPQPSYHPTFSSRLPLPPAAYPQASLDPGWTYAENLQGVSEPSASLRDANSHLSYLSQLQYFASFYRNEIWGFAPINPLCMKTDTIIYLFATPNGRSERSSLSLCTLYTLCMGTIVLVLRTGRGKRCTHFSSGALLSGCLDKAQQFFTAAREHLGYVFDYSDYDVACVLCYITQPARFLAKSEREGLEQSHYYLTLGMQICERIGAVNDNLYSLLIRERYLIRGLPYAEARNSLQQASTRSPWQKNWKQGKPVIEQYKYGRFVPCFDGILDNLQNVVHLLAQERNRPEEWRHQQEVCMQAVTTIKQLEERYGFFEQRPITAFLRSLAYFCIVICKLRLRLVLDTHQATQAFLRLLVSDNSGMRAFLLSEIWWIRLVDVLVEAIAFWCHYEPLIAEQALSLARSIRDTTPWARDIYQRIREVRERDTGHQRWEVRVTEKREDEANQARGNSNEGKSRTDQRVKREGDQYSNS